MKPNISSLPGIYLHIPFCIHKCGYCDFYSVTDQSLRETFADSIVNEMARTASRYQEDTFDTLYIGGGTPSVLNPPEFDRIFNGLNKYFRFDPDTEITIEVNPGTVVNQKLKFYNSLGINRISVGVQSFNENELKLLERIHSAEDAFSSIAAIYDNGFDNVSVDLMYALPAQLISNWNNTLQTILSHKPEHISAYNLTFEEGTPFYKKLLNGEINTLKSGEELEFFQYTRQMFREAGYIAYEISSYAIDESKFSRHNYKYWTHTNYLGFGPSAHSFWNNQRWSNYSSLEKYTAEIEQGKYPIGFKEILNCNIQQFEQIFLSLRTYQGLSLSDFEKKYKQPFTEIHKGTINNLIQAGLAIMNDSHFRLTEKGINICDEILSQFIID